jgi:hypothetical protein
MEAFKQLVLECMSRVIAQTATVRKLQDEHKLVLFVHSTLFTSVTTMDEITHQQFLSLPLIEGLGKAFKTHRVAVIAAL